MQSKQTLYNERGGMAALLSVIVLSTIIVTALTSIYVYLENRSRFEAYMRTNYQFSFVMEDMGRAVAQAYQIASSNAAACADGYAYVDCVKVCMQDTHNVAAFPPGSVLPPGTPQYAICVKNTILNKTINNADYFCTYNLDGTSTAVVFPAIPPAPANCATVTMNNNGPNEMVASSDTEKFNKIHSTKLQRWYGKLDSFFNTTIVHAAPGTMTAMMGYEMQPPKLLAWLLPEKAYADPAPPTCDPLSANYASCMDTNAQTLGKAIVSSYDCATQMYSGPVPGASTNPLGEKSCKACGNAERNGLGQGACVDISVCPPWTANNACNNGGGAGAQPAPRIHQMVRIQ